MRLRTRDDVKSKPDLSEPNAMLRISQSGVTLIELMVVTVIVAILASIAYPSYQAQVRKSRRAAAQAFLMSAGSRQQQRMVDVRSYADDMAELGMTTPPELAGFYTFDTTAPDTLPPSFSLTATPAGAQLKDQCGTLGLDQAGHKTAATSENCW